MSKHIKLEDAIRKYAEMIADEAYWEHGVGNGKPDEEDLDIARKYFSDLPTIEVSEDCISREWVYNELTKVTAVTPTQIDMLSDFTDIIKYAPSVVPTQTNANQRVESVGSVEPTTEQSSKVGEWQITDAYPHNVYCSECHKKFAQTHWAVWEDGSLPRNYCPNCGAKMKSEE